MASLLPLAARTCGLACFCTPACHPYAFVPAFVQVIDFYQIFSSVPKVFDVEFPEEYDKVTSWTDVFLVLEYLQDFVYPPQ